MSRCPGRVIYHRLLTTCIILFGMLTFQSSVAAITLPQANGDELTLPEPAKRIITLAPNLAELLFAAGAGEHLEAVVEYSNFPAQVADIQRVGDAFRIDLERIIELEPDLVVAWSSGNPQTALQKLEQLGIQVLQIEITRPEQIADTVEILARAAGSEDTGLLVAAQLRTKLEKLKIDNLNKSPVSFFYQVAARPLYTVNSQHIISQGIELCGGQNVFSELPALAPQVSLESVVLANPTVMIAAENKGEIPALEIWQDWPRLQAVKNDSMLYLSADQISQATPRFLDSIALACQFLDQTRASIKHLER
jgi:iron complex transport system substrate-binding protein